jgi:hypothetical protein
MDRLAVEALQAVAQHWAVRLVPDLLPDVDDQVGAPRMCASNAP